MASSLGNPVPGFILPKGAPRPDPRQFIITRTAIDHVKTGSGPALDIGNGREGDAVLAVADGRVDGLVMDPNGSRIIRVGHGMLIEGKATQSGYAHVQAPFIVTQGQLVKRGQKIASVGSTGAPGQPHLHYGLRVGGVAINPEPYINGDSDMSKSTATITLFPDGPHALNIPAGGKVDGYNLDGLVKSQTFPTGSSSVADGTAVITQDPKKAPNGTFYRCSGGIFAGLYLVPSQLADAGPVNPPPPTGDTDAAYNEGLAAAQAAVEAVPDR